MVASPASSARGDRLLEVRNLTVAFDEQPVVDAISFAIGRGEIVGLLGESGSGKSTAAYAMLGLVKPSG